MDASLNFHHLRYFWVTAREGSVTAAARKLHVTQPTVSEQLRLLEETLGEPLLRREGRRLVLTEVGRTVIRFADEIFSLGEDLVDTVRGRPTGKPARLTVGVAESVPKIVAYRILEPALGMHVVCVEDTQERLLAQLDAHALDMVISDEPAASGQSRAHAHELGQCGVSVFGTAKLVKAAREGFPRSLDGAPMLLPALGSALRREIDHWLDARSVAPKVIGEFQDPALMTVFAQAGAGLLVAPDAIATESTLAHGLKRLGAMKPLRQRFYVLTVDRRLLHPAVQRVASAPPPNLRSRTSRARPASQDARPTSRRR
ncbi:MAG: LysR family transcriptional regulator [Deltaproteobacteria bacterium]|nr:LysR family transcriptional regulator [Deltaproteobacteria bacterium]